MAVVAVVAEEGGEAEAEEVVVSYDYVKWNILGGIEAAAEEAEAEVEEVVVSYCSFLIFCKFFDKLAPTQIFLQCKPIFTTTLYIDL